MAYGDDTNNLTPLSAEDIDDFNTPSEDYGLPSVTADPEEEEEEAASFGDFNSLLASAAAQQNQEPTAPNVPPANNAQSSVNSFDFGMGQLTPNQQSTPQNNQQSFGSLEQLMNNRSEHLNNGAPQQDVSPLQNISFDDMSFNLPEQQVVDDEDNYADGESNGHPKKPIFKIVGIGIAVIVVLIAVSGFFKSKNKDSTTGEQVAEQVADTNQQVVDTNQQAEQVETTGETVEEPAEEPTEEGDNSTQEIVDNVTDGDIQIEQRGKLLTFNSMKYANKTVYKDTFFVNKFVEMRGGALMPKFKGKAKKLGSVIEFYVPMKTYNKFTNGVEVSIEYRAVFVDGEVYVTDVQLAD